MTFNVNCTLQIFSLSLVFRSQALCCIGALLGVNKISKRTDMMLSMDNFIVNIDNIYNISTTYCFCRKYKMFK